MGKKKRQNQNSNSNVADSSESESSKDSAQAPEGNEALCPHANKSVNLASVRKMVKANKDRNVHRACALCRKNKSELCKDCWICLRCGACNCGPEDADHRQDHYKLPRSDTHYLAFQTNTNLVWCFKCEKELPIDVNKKVQGCIDLIKKQYDPFSPSRHEATGGKVVNGTDSVSYLKSGLPSSHSFTDISLGKDVVNPVLNLTRVRGLMNLGNTCFFNSVLQCLAQTPGLVELLREMDVPGEKFSLELDGVEIDGVLEKHKSSELSEHLAKVLTEVSGKLGVETGDSKIGHNTVDPRRLLEALTSRCPQFEGGDQHDAHELLRHLLDSVHTEDLRRYQRAILKHIGYNKNLELEEDKKKFGKKLNQKVCETIAIRPDQIFKGSLVSILQCTVCNHISKREEPFLDLSLPVAQEKPQPPGIKRKQNCNSPVEEEQTEAVMSKHQMKKEKKAAKRSAKAKHSGKKKEEAHGEPTIEEEDKKDSVDGEQSDADVEDNACEEQDHKAEIVESGYSSEKQMSARGSPVTTRSPEEEVKPTDRDFHTCQPDPDSLANRAESGLGSVQELTVTIPEEANTECTSQDSVKVNASNGSPDISSDSQHCSRMNTVQTDFLQNEDLLLSETHPPDDENIDRTAMIFEWNCTGDVKSHSQESSSVSLSVSPQYGSDNVNLSPKGSPASGSHSNDNMSVCTSLPHSNDNMSVCNSLPENVSLILNSPRKGQLSQRDETSGSDERPESRMDCQKNRSSPVDLTELIELNPGLLKLSLEGMTCARDTEDTDGVEEAINITSDLPNKPAEPVVNDEPNGFVLVGGVTTITRKSPTPIPPPLPLFTASYSFTHSEPASQRSSGSFLKYRTEEGECSLHSCLNQFTTIEMLAGGNKVSCDACTERINKGNKDGKAVCQVSTKQLLIARLPPIMIFHLKRFQVQKFSFRKLLRHVDFPLVLDISPFCSVNEEPIFYSLYGVVEHSGTLHGGHYVAYVKVRSQSERRLGCPPPGKWYCISDSRVCDIDESAVLKAQAYLLFYERIL